MTGSIALRDLLSSGKQATWASFHANTPAASASDSAHWPNKEIRSCALSGARGKSSGIAHRCIHRSGSSSKDVRAKGLWPLREQLWLLHEKPWEILPENPQSSLRLL